MKKFIFLLVAVACFGMTQAQKLHVDKIYARALSLSNPEVDIATSPVTFQGVSSINSVSIFFSIDFKADIDLPAGFQFSMTFKPFNTTEDAVTMSLPNALSAGQVYHYSITGSYACGQYTSALVQESSREWRTTVGVYIEVPGQMGGGKTETMRIMNVTGIEDAEMENISVYPTSINDNMLKIKGLENTNVSIYAVNGQMVAQPQLMNGDVTIDMSNYVAGLYLVKLQNNNASKVVKVQLVK